MALLKICFFLLGIIAPLANAKPSHPFGGAAFNPGILPGHFDFAPPILPPPAHFHAPAPEPWLPEPHLHAAAPLAPEPWLPPPPAPVQFLPAPAPLLPPPAPLLPAPVPAPVVHHHHHSVAAPYPVPVPVSHAAPLSPPIWEPEPFVATPSYRAIPGPKTTTHHVSLGYAFPKFAVAPHAHLHSAPLHSAHLHSAPLLAHHHHHLKHHHSLF